MQTATIRSVCECQAALCAELDEHLQTLGGWATDYGSRTSWRAPAQTLGGPSRLFQAAWLCPFCMRHVLRSFDASALTWRERAAGESHRPGGRAAPAPG